MKRLWIVLYNHRHGTDTFPLFLEEPPSREEMIDATDGAWEGEEYDEDIEAVGPFDIPSVEDKTYTLDIDGALFRRQREALLDVLHLKLAEDTYESMQGLVNLTDSIADQAHDLHSIDCLLQDGEEHIATDEERSYGPHRDSGIFGNY